MTLHCAVNTSTIGAMPGPVTDARAYELRERYHAAFGGAELPVPVETIADCAETFGVSEEAMHWRLFNIGLVTDMPA